MLNKCILMGRLTKDPEIRYSQSAEPIAVARYTLAVNRRFKRENEPDADFITCVAFGKSAEFAEKYFKKAMMIAIAGRLQVRSWEDQQGQKRWSTEVVIEEQNFAESKKQNTETGSNPSDTAAKGKAHANAAPTGFDPFAGGDMDFNISDDDDLPF